MSSNTSNLSSYVDGILQELEQLKKDKNIMKKTKNSCKMPEMHTNNSSRHSKHAFESTMNVNVYSMRSASQTESLGARVGIRVARSSN